MSDFKVGDEVWYINTCHDGTDYYLHSVYVDNGKFESENGGWIYFDGNCHVYHTHAFKSKQDCIDAFKKRLDEL